MVDHHLSHGGSPFASIGRDPSEGPGRSRANLNWIAISAVAFCALCWAAAAGLFAHVI